MQSAIRVENKNNNSISTIAVYLLCSECAYGILKNGICNNSKCLSSTSLIPLVAIKIIIQMCIEALQRYRNAETRLYS